MHILDRYIGRQVLATTIIGVIVLSFVLVLGNLFKEIRPLLVDSGAPFSIVFEFVLQVIPFSLMFTVPWGFLTAVLLVFGRLSSDNEFTTMRMAGQSLWRISAPVFFLAFVLTGVCYWINIDVAPSAKGSISELLIKAATYDPKKLLSEGQAVTKFAGQNLLIDKKTGDEIDGMHIYQERTDQHGPIALHAEKVYVTYYPDKQQLYLDMHNVFIEETAKDGKQEAILMEQMPYELDLADMNRPKRKANRFTNKQLKRELERPDLPPKERAQFETELTRRITFSLACLVFAFIGVPLAIQTRRKDTSSGFAYGIAIASLYFVALIFADLSRQNTSILPHILLWLPNVLGVMAGIYFFRKTRLQA